MAYRSHAVADADLRQIISFSVGDEEFGLELLLVKEVIRVGGITKVPRAPAGVRGIINLRGDVIPIFSLRDKFGLPEQEQTASTRVIVVEIGGKLVGMMVDSASQVVRIPESQIVPPPPMLAGLSREFITGVGKLDDRLVIMLQVDRLLSTEEVVALDAIHDAVEEGAA